MNFAWLVYCLTVVMFYRDYDLMFLCKVLVCKSASVLHNILFPELFLFFTAKSVRTGLLNLKAGKKQDLDINKKANKFLKDCTLKKISFTCFTITT